MQPIEGCFTEDKSFIKVFLLHFGRLTPGCISSIKIRRLRSQSSSNHINDLSSPNAVYVHRNLQESCATLVKTVSYGNMRPL